MKTQRVYDLPTRLFHWLFAGLFITAFLIAKTIDDESPLYSYHMLAGFLLVFVVSLRVIWGIIGTKYARFSSFALNPQDLIQYLVGIVSGDRRKWVGHNPASSWATMIMLSLAVGLGITGYLMANGQKEQLEDIHELLANGFLVTVLMHIAGVVLHSLRHRDGLGFSMVTGAKTVSTTETNDIGAKPAVALVFVVLVGAFAAQLFKNYDSQTQTLKLFGTMLQLGENENENESSEGAEGSEAEKGENGDDDGDDD